MIKYLSKIIANFLIFLIKIYQKTLSFDHGPLNYLHPDGFCRFYPTCSEYGVQAIRKYGPIRGAIKTIWRVLRCNPFNKGGYDPVK